MKLLVVLIIAVIIFALVYFSTKKNTKKAALFAALAAAIAFVGPYIVSLTETQEPNTESTQENERTDDSSTYPDNQNSSNSEEPPSQFMQPEDPTPVGESSPTLDSKSKSELSIDKIANVKMEVQGIESRTIENVDAQIDVYNGSLTIEGQVDTYFFAPSVTGRYRFEISGLTSGTNHEVNLVIKNSGDGVVDSTSYGITNGSGLTIKDMQAGETYQVQVRYYSGYDSYKLVTTKVVE